MKIRKLPLSNVGDITFKALIEVLVAGEMTSDEIVKADKVSEELEKATGELPLDGDDYKFLLARIGKTNWNSTKDNRKAISSFITTIKDLKEVEVKIS